MKEKKKGRVKNGFEIPKKNKKTDAVSIFPNRVLELECFNPQDEIFEESCTWNFRNKVEKINDSENRLKGCA